jgi:serine protease Do
MATYGKLTAIALLLAFAAPATAPAQSILDRLERRINNAVAPPDESVPRNALPAGTAPGYLGLTADSKDGAVEVLSIAEGGPAATAGIRRGDRIVSVGGVEVTSLDDMAALIGKLPAGSRIDLGIQRAGRNQKVALTLGRRDEGTREPLPGPDDEEMPEERALEEGSATLGVRAVPVTADLQRRYGLTVRRGAVIQEVVPGSPAERYGLPVGAAITAIDGARIDSPEDLAALISGARPGDTVEISFYLRDQVFRNKVRLAPTVAAAPAPREGRPLLRRLERTLEGVRPAEDDERIADLQAQIATMQSTIFALQERIDALEARLPKAEKAGDTADQPLEKEPAKTPELTPPLKPLEP